MYDARGLAGSCVIGRAILNGILIFFRRSSLRFALELLIQSVAIKVHFLLHFEDEENRAYSRRMIAS